MIKNSTVFDLYCNNRTTPMMEGSVKAARALDADSYQGNKRRYRQLPGRLHPMEHRGMSGGLPKEVTRQE